ncbi:MAG: aminoglycoside phosphotransferase family protein [Nocardioidaceae bacterium]|nr:aminoglycoside phosphotransferase family protein [Nocardioidaceae bacterium]MCL2614148.1 aminoglycoside phosphotransferase family protein [Nocardioidaceae bacterium]
MIPPGLQAYAGRGPEWAAWLERLPGLLRDLLAEWELTVDGDSRHGNTALVLPVRTTAGRQAALKIVWPHWEAEHEALALQHWHGAGAVRLLRADPHRWALLLERLSTEDLSDLWDVEACGVVGDLYRRLHRPAPPQLRTLSDQAARWADELGRIDRSAPVPHRMVQHARSLAADLASDPATDGTLIHTDLHFHNVLAAPHGGWVAIDPKPLSGDAHYELAPMLWNRWSELDGRVRDGVRDRFVALVDAAGLDEDRARDWVIVRMLVSIKGELLDNHAPHRDWITAMLAIAKAVQD